MSAARRGLTALGGRLAAWLGPERPGQPRMVPADQGRGFWPQRCLGGMALVLLLCQALTGAFLLAGYSPTVEGAMLSAAGHAGGFRLALRALHAAGSDLLVALVLLHMLRVLAAGAYASPRRLNWLSGVFLLLAALTMDLSGRVMAWDQQGYWLASALTALAGHLPLVGAWLAGWLRGGEVVGQAALSRFFALHLALPLAMVPALFFHFLMVRRRGVAPPL